VVGHQIEIFPGAEGSSGAVAESSISRIPNDLVSEISDEMDPE
jgi:hypothetical protein